MITKSFNKSRIATSVSLIMGAVATMPGLAQEASDQAQLANTDFEVIEVSGIRESLTKSMLTKRAASGVVDAISAEDIGKFPDTNLAESLQRITGVSIDRVNGEGSRITVRGFGPDYNLVTLNGRQMPTASIDATTASGSRSFDFGNLASEGVAAVEVYKTSLASQPTGGIGSTVNLVTAKPLSNPGIKASFAAKAVSDQSTEEGNKITPELSGIYSQTFADDTFGIQLIGSYQERDSGSASAETGNGWYTIQGTQGDWGSLPQDGSFVNPPQENDVYSVPRNLAYNFNEFRRTRTNGQLTLQYRPVDEFTATLDYTYSELENQTLRQQISTWFNGNPAYGEYTQGTNTQGSVIGPVIYADSTCCDIGLGTSDFTRVNENNSVGLNLEWLVNDNLLLELDYHHSTAEAGPGNNLGSDNVISGVQFDRVVTEVDYSRDFPVMDIMYADGVTGLDPARMLTSGTAFRNSFMRSEIDQFQFRGNYTFDDGIITSIDFGLASIEVKNRSAYSNAQRDTWGGYGSPDDYPDDIFIQKSVADRFDDMPGAGSANLEPFYYATSMQDFLSVISQIATANGDTLGPCGTELCMDPNFTTDRRTTEEQWSAYVQVNMSFDIGDMPANLAVGARYEDTTVDSSAKVPEYETIAWTGDNEFSAVPTGNDQFTSLSGGYDHFLPSVDFNIEVMEDLILRASYSETISRPNYADIQGGLTINQLARFNGGSGSAGNPNLLPFESTNIDFSAEYYYGDGSYVSAGYFDKSVDNFIGNDTYTDTVFDLATPFGGPRYQAAVAALGEGATTTAIREYIIAQGVGVDGNNILGIPGEDPILEYTITQPVNSDSRAVDGLEMAWQHLFGDSGFGFIVNYTAVDGDVKYDDYNTNKGENPNQFVLLGLSDTANAVLFYDKDDWEVRIAYNWRDKFLDATIDGNGERNPTYIEDYSQIDVNISYDINEHLVVFAEGINVTNEYKRSHSRHPNMLIGVYDAEPRYQVGLRYTF
ncbi:TonB-dependent receptor [Alteromonas aestuariivivens]|uniref:TonB-dependent receptor n=1 Tax=Alteromonas aestuariivivens TaxID=1938339 RepID=A0A3D8MAN7_9ALTE|nr:TonB-dependent receptor [Alteromonas aestuariivivens]RDV26795.1 TonB-dependent receptor [Alteromonas aestuariivivens]